MINYENINQNDLILFIIILVISILTLIITRKLLKVSFPYFFMGFLGLITGLILGSLISQPLTRLPGNYGRWIPIVVNIFVAVAMLDLFLAQAKTASTLFSKIFTKALNNTDTNLSQETIVDTSVFIDGRILPISETGFLMGKLIIPRFILEELQNVADSSDSLKRSRGRRGLDVLDKLQKNKQVEIELVDDELKDDNKIDIKIVNLAKKRNANVMTADYNLNKVAQIENIHVLNINSLSESLKPLLIPGEELIVKIIQKGKEKNQGIGYLDDGTMIVVENGANRIGETLRCEVIRIFHTAAGKMIFVEQLKNKRMGIPNEKKRFG